jgi:outer membrane protein assembly factor BamA
VNCAVKFVVLLVCLAAAANAVADTVDGASTKPVIPPPAELEAEGAIVGEIVYDKQDVFDTSIPEENNALYRLANRWHIVTRDSVIRNQLLFRTGDLYSKRLLEESERLLRQNAYFYDVKIEPIAYENGVVDVRVWTRDLWTLMPGISISRSGGENRTRVSLSERNLLGRGVSLRFSYVDNVDRETGSFQYFDRTLGRTWTSLFLEYADSSDGDTKRVSVIRPFYQLDARWSAGGTFFDDTREVSFYDLGDEAAEYAADTNSHSVFAGWSPGLQNGWVRRWTAGLVYDDNQFSAVPAGTLPSLVPADRKLVYPFIGLEILEDRYESTSNRDQIGRTEDFFLGTRLWASVGYATEDFGADRESVLYRFEASSGFGSIEKKALLLSSSLTGRVDEGRSVNTELSVNARYYNQISDKRLFFMTLDGSQGNRLDLDNLLDLGGDTGLRGYPLRYQTGESRLLLTIEERYFTDWYPFRLFRVGGAAFIDAGRVWGDNPFGSEPLGWLKDIGIGLRLAPTRASGRDVIHIDVAFPLDGDPTIDSVQFLIQSKRSF